MASTQAPEEAWLSDETPNIDGTRPLLFVNLSHMVKGSDGFLELRIDSFHSIAIS